MTRREPLTAWSAGLCPMEPKPVGTLLRLSGCAFGHAWERAFAPDPVGTAEISMAAVGGASRIADGAGMYGP